LRCLVYTAGGAPDASQRKELNAIMAPTRPPVAILTPSALARAIGTAFTWFNPRLRVFAPRDLNAALEHLELSVIERRAATEALSQLQTALGIET
jgi:hypothetical protein